MINSPSIAHVDDDGHKPISGVDLISAALPFGRLWYTKRDDAVEYAQFRSRSHDALIRVYDAAGNLIERGF